ncbi:hypothetical protein J4402_03155 [Candidatus Pacearchaeota archaeon]|nr:hypothetical protein [Candidatus Pacearchaeota archaeon]
MDFKPDFWKSVFSITIGYYFFSIFSDIIFGGNGRGLDGKIGSLIIKIPGYSVLLPFFFIIVTSSVP